jgi:predicted RNase H-like HicB family nuclease
MHYIALVHKEKNSDYGVSFPDFPGCVSAGKTVDQAKLMAQEAALSHISLLKEMQEPIPTPSTLEQIMANCENRDAFALLIEIPSSHVVRINITVAEDTLFLIDQRAKKLHLSRSALLVKAALEYGEEVSAPF